MTDLSPAELAVIRFLSPKMHATALQVGNRLIGDKPHVSGSAFKRITRIGASHLGLMRKRGLVMRLPDIGAWRLTIEGREIAQRLRDEERKGVRNVLG